MRQVEKGIKPLSVHLSNSAESSFKYKRIRTPAFTFNWHCHREFEIMFMLGSEGKFFIGDRVSYYRKNALFLLGSNLPHTWHAAEGRLGQGVPHQAILVQFAENFGGLNSREAPELRNVSRLLQLAMQGVQFAGRTRAAAGRLLEQMEHLDGVQRFVQLILLLDLLSKASPDEMQLLSNIEVSHRLQPRQQSRIDRVCKFLNEHYQKKLCLEDAARVANMSPTAFSRFFKRSTGRTFVQYVNQLRIGRACKLLIESDHSIAEICYEAGFHNISNFNRRFFECHNMSPLQYRKEFTSKSYLSAGAAYAGRKAEAPRS